MTLQEIITSLSSKDGFWLAIIIIFLTLVEVTPIKINPLSWFANILGRAINSEVMKEMGKLKQEVVNINSEVKGIKSDVTDIREEAKEREANNRRTRILEFGDEVLHEVDYSKEHWDQILLDITEYENYCDDHPRYMNNVAKATIKHIKHMYDKHLDEDSFL